jgi:uncharacterized damage-inducible protein DinB
VSKPILRDAFGHHLWATLRVIDACLALSAEQLETAVPGTYGSIIATVRHLVGGDRWYLVSMSGDRVADIDENQLGLPELRAEMERNGATWTEILGEDPDPDSFFVGHSDDGFESHATVSIRLAQALHHGTDHRSQICTALTNLGLEPPGIDVWDFGLQNGRFWEVPPTSTP